MKNKEERRKGGLGLTTILLPSSPPCFFLCVLAACGGGTRDVVPESRDEVVRGDAGGGGDYEYLARRPLAAVALAEARGIDPAVARAAVDRLADALGTCAASAQRDGTAVSAAARVVARVDATGTVAATSARVDPPGPAVTQAALCLVAPLRRLTFPPAADDARGLAVEALWGPGR
jgi:hypothetical protein